MKQHYKPFIFFSFLLLLSFTSDEKYLIDIRLLPGTTYKIMNKSESVSTVDFQAEEDILSRLKSSGVKFPLESEGTQVIIETIKTGDLKSDSSFDVNVQIDQYKNDRVTNGVETSLPDSLNFTGLSMHGTYTNDKKLKNLVIESDKFRDDIKAVIVGTVEKMLSNIKYPDYPLAIGDTFKQEVPVDLPLGGGIVLNMKLIITYNLMEVKDNKARFKTNTEMVINSNNESFSVKSDGGGEGELVHDLKLKYAVEYTANLNMNFEIRFDKFTMITKSNTKTTYRLL